MMKTKIFLLKKLKKRESNYFKNWRKKKEKILAEKKKGTEMEKKVKKIRRLKKNFGGRLNKLNSDFAKISEIRKRQWKEKD